MFKEARIRLTLWYLAILSFILLLFSSLIFYLGSRQLERGYHQAEMRATLRQAELLPPNYQFEFSEMPEGLILSKHELLRSIFFLNGFILFVASFLAYFLAGRTLQPIEQMMTSQKRFIADAAHELRTPITAMKTALEVTLRDKKLTKPAALIILKENLQDVEHLENLSNQLLLLNSQQAQSLQFETVALKEVVKHLKRQFKTSASLKQIKLQFKFPDIKLQLDQSKLERLLAILLDNAINYSPKKSKVMVDLSSNKKQLRLVVADHGLGMSQEEQAHVFERFYRADQARSRQIDQHNGFGLGLAIAQQIVDLWQGTINVSSRPGQGSSFTVLLPLQASTKVT